MDSKILIAYFAQKGHENDSKTATLAAKLKHILTEKGYDDASLFAIVTTEEYPADVASMEMVTKLEKEQKARPELVGKYSGMKHVERILLVTPNWWDSVPAAVLSFFDGYAFGDKRLVPVVLHGGGAGDKVREEIRNFLPHTWVLPGVDVSDDAVESSDAELQKAVEQLFEPSRSKY